MGLREDRGLKIEERKREPRSETRCDCKANFRAQVDIITSHWYVTVFNDNHNHDLMGPKFFAMLPGNRRMGQSDVIQMNSMMNAGIGPSHTFASFANQSGGYDNVGFRKVDIYNQIQQQSRRHNTDAMAALHFLQSLSCDEMPMYFYHTVEDNGRLQHLFWCDGRSQKEYELFGDVLAFDATYSKNKYHLSVVIFSGVNHHNRTTIFATAVVTNECEETYVWLLEQFAHAMKGENPTLVITDGDIAMKNAIVRVFPSARHRLFGWNLLRNSISNVKTPKLTAEFEKCMLGEYDVEEFEQKWTEIVAAFGLQEHPWVNNVYEKRHMWATTYFQNHFFGGFRMTSRCESLHSELGKFVHTRYNLHDFLQHYHRCISKIRFRELEDDFKSIHGEPVIQSPYDSLERSASKHYTRNAFFMFRKLIKASFYEVRNTMETLSVVIFKVGRIAQQHREWHVSFYPDECEFHCSCLWMESRGIPCEHIVAVLVFQEIEELPSSLVLKRWTKGAKDNINFVSDISNGWDSHKVARSAALMDMYTILSDLKYNTLTDFNEERERLLRQIDDCKTRRLSLNRQNRCSSETSFDAVRNPVHANTKGRGSFSVIRTKRQKMHSTCKQSGHNRVTCPLCGESRYMSQPFGNIIDDPYDEGNHLFTQ